MSDFDMTIIEGGGGDAVRAYRELQARLDTADATVTRLQRELKGWRPKHSFMADQLPLPHGDHPTVQIYREQVVKFRDRYLRLAMYLSEMLGCTVETLCEANLIWGENKLAHLTRLVEGLPKFEGVKIWVCREKADDVWFSVCYGTEGDYEVYATRLTKDEATALAALLEHRRGMNGGKL